MSVTVRQIEWATEAELSTHIRREVFVIEQNIPEAVEWDGLDDQCVHVVAFDGDQAVGTGRLMPTGKIGRMAVMSTHRNMGVGGQILLKLIELAKFRGDREITLSAQIEALKFYSKYGFQPIGDLFVTAEIEHQNMRRSLV